MPLVYKDLVTGEEPPPVYLRIFERSATKSPIVHFFSHAAGVWSKSFAEVSEPCTQL